MFTVPVICTIPRVHFVDFRFWYSHPTCMLHWPMASLNSPYDLLPYRYVGMISASFTKDHEFTRIVGSLVGISWVMASLSHETS